MRSATRSRAVSPSTGRPAHISGNREAGLLGLDVRATRYQQAYSGFEGRNPVRRGRSQRAESMWEYSPRGTRPEAATDRPIDRTADMNSWGSTGLMK